MGAYSTWGKTVFNTKQNSCIQIHTDIKNINFAYQISVVELNCCRILKYILPLRRHCPQIIRYPFVSHLRPSVVHQTCIQASYECSCDNKVILPYIRNLHVSRQIPLYSANFECQQIRKFKVPDTAVKNTNDITPWEYLPNLATFAVYTSCKLVIIA